MTKMLILVLLCLGLCGCTTIPMPIIINHPKINVGMTKEQFINEAMGRYGAPNLWSKQIMNGKTYETWYYYNFSETFDFVDNILTGYSSRSIYHSATHIEDLRDYQK